MKKQNNGITLVALVITIIILLILAGITILFTGGHEGIIEKAQMAGKNYMNASEYEEEELLKYNDEIDKYNYEKVVTVEGHDLIDTTKNTTTPILDTLYLTDSIYNYKRIDIVWGLTGNSTQTFSFYPKFVTDDRPTISDTVQDHGGSWGIYFRMDRVNEKEFKIIPWNHTYSADGIIGVIGYK